MLNRTDFCNPSEPSKHKHKPSTFTDSSFLSLTISFTYLPSLRSYLYPHLSTGCSSSHILSLCETHTLLLPASYCHFLDIPAGFVESSSLQWLVSADCEFWLSRGDKRDTSKPNLIDWLISWLISSNEELNTFQKYLYKDVICIIIIIIIDQVKQGSKIWLFLLDNLFNPLNMETINPNWQTVFSVVVTGCFTAVMSSLLQAKKNPHCKHHITAFSILLCRVQVTVRSLHADKKRRKK